MRKAIFTVNLGDYDHLPPPAQNNPAWDKILFTDQDVSTWVRNKWDRVIKVDPSTRPDIVSRDIKWRSHIHIPEYDIVCYHDANIIIRKELPIRPFRVVHERRFSIRREADALNKLAHRCTSESVEAQLEYYEAQGFPDDQGLYYGGFFARYHNLDENEVCELTYDHVSRFTSRDQLAYPYAIWKTGHQPVHKVDKAFFVRHTRMRIHKKTHPIYG